MRIFAAIGVVFLVSPALFAQSSDPRPGFDTADVHSSPHTTFPFMQGGVLRGDRYVVKNATMVDLISTAYGVDVEKVVSGPNWLELDRFDILAKAPPTTSPEA